MAMLHYKITEKEFWNFNDPLFDAENDWLRTFLSHGYNYDLHFLRTLGNTSLQELKIVNNVHVTDEVFLGEMPHLRKFHFQDGYLSSFNSGNCKGKRNLTEISLLNNNLREIPPRGLSSCQELRILDLSNQDTVKINKEELSNLLKLEELNLSAIEVNTIESGFLPPLPNLKSLNLSFCGIMNISVPEPFSIFPKLEILDLSHNLIANLDKLFIKRSNLKVLNISDNYGISLSNLSIANQDMKILDLSKTALTRFPPVHSCKIEVLNLAMNSFYTIENLSDNNVTVNYLDLSDSTELTKWTDKNIFKNKQFQNISKYSFKESRAWVSVLKLTGISANDFTDDMTSSMNFLSEVDLDGIHITCNNCSSPFIKWLNSERSTKILHLSSERPLLMCSDKKGITVQRYKGECLEKSEHPLEAGGNICFIDKLLILTFILLAIEL
ncbi:leucine-rich repeat transmembrane neuronal protein 4 isoform X2 [Anabrus simplex]